MKSKIEQPIIVSQAEILQLPSVQDHLHSTSMQSLANLEPHDYQIKIERNRASPLPTDFALPPPPKTPDSPYKLASPTTAKPGSLLGSVGTQPGQNVEMIITT